MSHLDEGLLTALLDNELSPAERLAADTHLGECAECRRLLEEVKAVAAEADGLVETIQFPNRPAPDQAGRPPKARPRWTSGRWRALAWAASVTLALGLGWMASDLRQDHAAGAGPGESIVPALQSRPLESRVHDSTAPTPAPSAPEALKPSAKQPAALARDAVREERRAPAPEEPGKEAAKAVGNVATAEADRLADAGAPPANLAAPAPAAPARAAEPLQALAATGSTAFRQISMEEAVRTLSGSIRLVDGLRPQRILRAPGRAVPGADPSMDLVRVIYEDPPGRELWLDQQRPVEAEGGNRPMAPGLLPGDTVAQRGAGGPATVRWIDQRGFRLGLTGFLGTDSLRAMIGRVN